jgi:hypothetical protein
MVGLKAACMSLETGSGSRFCVRAFDRNLAPITVKFLSHLIYIIKKYHKFFTFIAIYKDNATINYITTEKIVCSHRYSHIIFR